MKLAIVAPAKSGSTAIYNSCRAALSRDEACYSIFEPQMPWLISKLRNYDFSATFVTKIMASRVLASKSDFHMEWFDKRILLVRDVKDLMVSELLFRPMIDPLSFGEQALAEFVKMIEAKERDPGSISVLQLHKQADELGISSLNWDIYRAILKRLVELRSKYDFSVIHFEDYAAGDYSGLRQVLGRKVGPTDLSTSWVSHIQRKGKHGEWRNWFTAEDIEFTEAFFKEYNEAFGYEPVGAQELNDGRIDPEFGSQYVVRKSQTRREQAKLLGTPGEDYTSEEDIALLVSRARDGSAKHIRKLVEKHAEGAVPDSVISRAEIMELKQFGEILA
jgi:hypothetical protein